MNTEPEESESYEPQTIDQDRYPRKKHEADFVELLKGMEIDLEPHTPEWWAERDRQVANERALELAEAEGKHLHARADDLRHRGGFPDLAIEAALSVTLDTPALRLAKIFPKLPSRIAVFAGGVGTGKTTAATWLSLRGDDHDPGFIRASELERAGRYDHKLREWIKERTSLVIDDLGAEIFDSKRMFASLLDEVVDSFYSRKRILIMTTNLLGRVPDAEREQARREGREPEPQFVERYGDRVRSRVKQIGQWCDCGMVDLRTTTPNT